MFKNLYRARGDGSVIVFRVLGLWTVSIKDLVIVFQIPRWGKRQTWLCAGLTLSTGRRMVGKGASLGLGERQPHCRFREIPCYRGRRGSMEELETLYAPWACMDAHGCVHRHIHIYTPHISTQTLWTRLWICQCYQLYRLWVISFDRRLYSLVCIFLAH